MSSLLIIAKAVLALLSAAKLAVVPLLPLMYGNTLLPVTPAGAHFLGSSTPSINLFVIRTILDQIL